MVCECGHMRGDHQDEKDFGAFGFMCNVKTCNCEYYRNKIMGIKKC